jgi:hypothetical protein
MILINSNDYYQKTLLYIHKTQHYAVVKNKSVLWGLRWVKIQ